MEKHFSNTNIRWFCEKDIGSNKVRDHCHLTGKYKGPAHQKSILNVKQIKIILLH